jgi:Flp pilus assembly protein TadD
VRIELHESAAPSRCAYCHGSLGASPGVCGKCRARFDRECFLTLVKCPTLGCGRIEWGRAPRSVTRELVILAFCGVGMFLGLLVTGALRLPDLPGGERHHFQPHVPERAPAPPTGREGVWLPLAVSSDVSERPHDDALTFFERGLADELASRYEDALVNYTRAIDLAPKTLRYRECRGSLRRLCGDEDGARVDYRSAAGLLAVRPNEKDWAPLCGRGYFRGLAGDYEGAAEDCTRAIERNPTSSFALSSRAYARLHLGDLDGASADLERALELDPGNAYAFENRGRLRHVRGDVSRARADFERALQLDVRRERTASLRIEIGALDGARVPTKPRTEGRR